MNSQNILQQINAEAKFIENSIGYQKTKIGTIPKDWKVKKLKDISNRVQRKNDGKSHNVLTISSKGGFLNQTERFSKVIAGENLAKYILLRKNEFAYNKGNSKTYPYGCIYRLEDYEEALVPNVYYCFEIREGVTEFYKHYFIAGKLNKFLARVINTGVRNDGLLNLNVTDFFDVPVAAPPIKEQQKIASILSAWDKAIEPKEKLIEQKKQQKKGLMQKLLTGEVRLPGFYGEWEKVSFSDIFIKTKVKKHQIKTNEYLESGKYPVVDQGQKKVTAYSNDEEKVFEVPETGVIVFGDHTREIKFIDFDFIIGADGTQVLMTKDDYDVRFYYYHLLIQKIPNTGYNRHFKFLKEMIFNKPSLKEQKAISNLLSTIDKELDLLNAELSALNEQKKGLMQLLLTGKVRVKV
ncbi:Type I restriction-modification system, specificity subunit S [Caldibacillus thermoamylovorans]|uniref:restriction endonuclease subunit S n=1 Tax=Bacillaceae TaxID=186817 RepID=UPI0005B73896|nr:restriction endonuclease subunit S [Caldibacillus thermoamylovorans]KIO68721.1 Type I restriction-modification system, specificity subunit S [Caldibacillus thermoamylovorans]